ncbi:hypothetical protein K2X05_09040, partial [bacterium]|nr:hypothetical protein [bacterium]
EQKIASTKKECFLELKYSADQKMVELRAVVTNAHEGHLAPIGSLQAQYQFIGGSIQKNGYYFQDKTPQAPVKQLVLIAEDPQNPATLIAAIFHDGHHDPVTCEGIIEATDAELVEATDLFANFDHLGEEEHAH